MSTSGPKVGGLATVVTRTAGAEFLEIEVPAVRRPRSIQKRRGNAIPPLSKSDKNAPKQG